MTPLDFLRGLVMKAYLNTHIMKPLSVLLHLEKEKRAFPGGVIEDL